MKVYDYIFYRWFRIVSYFENDVPHWYATAQLTIIDLLIVTSLICVFAPKWMKLWMESKSTWIEGLFVMLIIFIPNYLLYIKRDRFKKVVEKFASESKKQKIIGNIFIITFTFIIICIAVELQSNAVN